MKAYLVNTQHDTQHMFSWVAVFCHKKSLSRLTGFTQRHINVHACCLESTNSVYQTLVANPESIYMSTDQVHWEPINKLYLESLKLVKDSVHFAESLRKPRVIEGEFVESTHVKPEEMTYEEIYQLARHLQSASLEMKPTIQSEYRERYSAAIYSKIASLIEVPWTL